MGVQINGSEGNVIATKGTFSGDVGIGGTLTYEDVTNIDSVGLITARSGIEIGARPGVAASISVDGNAIFSGITTATTLRSTTGIVTTLTATGLTVDSGTTNTCATFQSSDAGAVINLTDNSARSSISQNGTDLLIISDTDAGDADSTIKFQVDSGTKAIIDSSGRVMIGNTNASTMFAGADDLVVGNTTGEHGITIISQNNSIGRILFSDSTSSGAATYQGQINYNHSADELILSTYTLGQIVAKTSNTERVRIDASGRVLIGVTASYANASIDELQIGNNSSSNQSGLTIGSTDECAIAFADDGDARAGSITYNHGAESMIFKCNGQNEHLRIRGGGDVTTTGDTGFTRTTAGFTARAGDSFNIARSSGTPLEICRVANTGNLVNFFYGTTNVAAISYNGSTMTYGGTSDYRLKENIVEMTGGIDAVKKLNPIKFNFIATPEKTVEGFIAHEVQEVIPQAVTGEKDCEVDEEGKGYQQLDPAQLVPTLTTALQEAISRIETLEAEVAALKSN